MSEGFAAVVLAAGTGTRLAPLTEHRPKALCPIGHQTLLDRALDSLRSLGLCGPWVVAVNAHHHPRQISAAVGDRAHLSLENPVALGTAGAIGALRDWIDGRDVVVLNADSYLDGDIASLTAEPPGPAGRLLVRPQGEPADFGPWRYIGAAAIGWAQVRTLAPVPSGLYEVLWAHERPGLVPFAGTAIDCGTPADYLAANLHDSHGASVIGTGAVVEGTLTRSVVWPGGLVRSGEHLVDAIRIGTDVTVDAAR